MSTLKAVNQFHVAMNYRQPTPDVPTLDKPTAELRVRLIAEELKELADALEKRDAVEALDALCDLQYVLTGAVLALGYQHVFGEAFNWVHQSNMKKLWTAEQVESCQDSYLFTRTVCNRWIATRADGKVMKPPGWTKPDLSKLLEKLK